jgi:hypothetical protein
MVESLKRSFAAGYSTGAQVANPGAAEAVGKFVKAVASGNRSRIAELGGSGETIAE